MQVKYSQNKLNYCIFWAWFSFSLRSDALMKYILHFASAEFGENAIISDKWNKDPCPRDKTRDTELRGFRKLLKQAYHKTTLKISS